jgi:ApaG protein
VATIPQLYDVFSATLQRDVYNAGMNEQTENQIIIDVETDYIEGESSPEEDRYVFSYTITIRNDGNAPAKLLTRHWVITDANGHVQEVKGEGVVGEQPHLNPGEGFKYTSGTILETPVGVMQGSYQMVTDEGEEFDATIDPFRLSIPRVLH